MLPSSMHTSASAAATLPVKMDRLHKVDLNYLHDWWRIPDKQRSHWNDEAKIWYVGSVGFRSELKTRHGMMLIKINPTF